MTLIEHIHFLRKARGISEDKFLKEIGTEAAELIRAENTETLPIHILSKISLALGVHTSDILIYNGSPDLPDPKQIRPIFLPIWAEIDPFLEGAGKSFLLLKVSSIHSIQPAQIAAFGPPKAKIIVESYGGLSSPETIYTVCSFDEILALLNKHSIIFV